MFVGIIVCKLYLVIVGSYPSQHLHRDKRLEAETSWFVQWDIYSIRLGLSNLSMISNNAANIYVDGQNSFGTVSFEEARVLKSKTINFGQDLLQL